MVLVTIAPDSTRDDLQTCLAAFNDQAKAEARRGFSGVQGRRYADLHDTMNALITAMHHAPLVTLGAD